MMALLCQRSEKILWLDNIMEQEPNFEIKQSYVSGMHFSTGAIRKYKNKVLDGEFKDIEFYQETFTKKNKKGEWGKAETSFYAEGTKEYENALDLLKELKANMDKKE